MTFNEELRQALRPGPAPRGLSDRVLARLAASDDTAAKAAMADPVASTATRSAVIRPATGRGHGARPRDSRRPSWMGLGVAASLLAVVASSAMWLEHDRQRQARDARADVLRALSITNQQLHDIQARVSHTGAPAGD